MLVNVLNLFQIQRFCSGCSHKDKNLEEKQEKKKKQKVEKALKSLEVKSKRDWGSGQGVAGVIDRFCVVPSTHFGRIPGVPAGRLWDTRLTVSILFNATVGRF